MGCRPDHSHDKLYSMSLRTDPDRPVDHDELADLTGVMNPILDEIVGPDMDRPTRRQPDTRAVIELEMAPLGFSRRRSTASWI